MKAMVIERIVSLQEDERPLTLREMPIPEPGPGEIRIKIAACGVCHTELDEIEGRTAPPQLPVIPGHEVVGRVDALGPDCRRFVPGERVGVGWIHPTRCRPSSTPPRPGSRWSRRWPISNRAVDW